MSTLRSRSEPELLPSVNGRNCHLTSQDSIRNGNHLGTEQVVAVALDLCVFDLLNHNQQVSVHTAARSTMTLTAHSKLHAVLNSGRNAHGDCLALAHKSGASAFAARIGHYAALTIALRAGRSSHHPSEKGIGSVLYLTASLAGRAGLHIALAAGPASVAVRTWTAALNNHFLGATVCYFLKSKAHARADIPSAKHPAA